MHFASVTKMPLPSGTWSSATVEVALRDGKITYCRPHIVNLLATNDACLLSMSDFGGHMLSVRFFTSKKGGIGEGRQVSAQVIMHIAAALDGC